MQFNSVNIYLFESDFNVYKESFFFKNNTCSYDLETNVKDNIVSIPVLGKVGFRH